MADEHVKSINVEPDGMLSAAYYVVQKLRENHLIYDDRDQAVEGIDSLEGELIQEVFHELVACRKLIAKSSWMQNEGDPQAASDDVGEMYGGKDRLK